MELYIGNCTYITPIVFKLKRDICLILFVPAFPEAGYRDTCWTRKAWSWNEDNIQNCIDHYSVAHWYSFGICFSSSLLYPISYSCTVLFLNKVFRKFRGQHIQGDVVQMWLQQSKHRALWPSNSYTNVIGIIFTMAQSASWESSSSTASEDILWNPNVHYRIHNRPPCVSIFSEINEFYVFVSFLRAI